MFQPIEILRLSVIISKRIIGSQFAERGGNNVSTADYFIYLLSCFLNDEKPRGSEQTDWQEIFRLAENHSVTAIIASLTFSGKTCVMSVAIIPGAMALHVTLRLPNSFATVLAFLGVLLCPWLWIALSIVDTKIVTLLNLLSQ